MLINPKREIKPLSSQKRQMAMQSKASGIGISLQSMKDIEQNIGKIQRDMHYHFWTKGQWSMHELLEYLLLQTGPADVWLSTWTITEIPARKLFLLKTSDMLIQSLYCVLDHRIRDSRPKPLQLLEQTADAIKFMQCHAKSLVIVNADWAVSVVGSANFSKNPRLEAGVICTVPEIVVFNQTIIKNELDR